MRTIWKYPLRDAEAQSVPLPPGSKVLSIQYQGDDLVLWAEVDPVAQATIDGRLIFMFDTGQRRMTFEGLRYIATVQSPGKTIVHHFFEAI